MYCKAVIVGTLLTLVSYGATGQVSDEILDDDKAMSFDRLDQNGDGVLEEIEVLALQDDSDWEGVQFDTLDDDSDGAVTREEWMQYFRDQNS